MFLQNKVKKEKVSGSKITWQLSQSGNFLTFMLTFFCSTDGGHDRCSRSCGRRVVGRRTFELLGLQLCVDPQTLQSFGGEISLQHRCLFVTVVQPKGYVPVSGCPWSTQIHQAQFVSVRGIGLILRVHLLSDNMIWIMNVWTAKNRFKLELSLGFYLLHAVALSLVAQGGQAEQVSLLHLSVDLVIGRFIPGRGHQVNRHLWELTNHLSHIPFRDQPPHHSASWDNTETDTHAPTLKTVSFSVGGLI